MADQYPSPPIPAFVDLRHYRDMPLEVQTLLDSEIAGVGDAEIFRCGVLLWCKSWQSVPCGSLEDNDATLARACGLGRDLRTWTRIKADVLRGFRKASDGRLYHWMVCKKAAKAWNDSSEWQWGKRCDALRKVNKGRKDAGQEPLPMPAKPGKVSCGWDKNGPIEGGGSDTDPGESSGGTPPTSAPVSTGAPDGIPVELAGKEGEGKEKGKEVERNHKGSSGADAPDPPPPDVPVETPPVVEAVIPVSKPAQPALQLTPDDDLDLPLKLDRSPEAQAVHLWNDTAQRVNAEVGRTEWPIVQALNPSRRAKLKNRLRESGGIKGWKVALEKAAAIRWLRGETPRSQGHENWRFSIKTLLGQEFFTQLMEGTYDDDPSRRQKVQLPGSGNVLAGARAARARRHAGAGSS